MPMTIVFLFEDFLKSIKDDKGIFHLHEHLSGLRVNFHKSEVTCFGGDIEKYDQYIHQLFHVLKGKNSFLTIWMCLFILRGLRTLIGKPLMLK
jgi:hypothetical protein